MRKTKRALEGRAALVRISKPSGICWPANATGQRDSGRLPRIAQREISAIGLLMCFLRLS